MPSTVQDALFRSVSVDHVTWTEPDEWEYTGGINPVGLQLRLLATAKSGRNRNEYSLTRGLH